MDSYGGHGVETRDGDVIVDVGANIGMFMLSLARRLSRMTYYAIEPIPPIFAALEKNAGWLEHNILCLPVGLAGMSGDDFFCNGSLHFFHSMTWMIEPDWSGEKGV